VLQKLLKDSVIQECRLRTRITPTEDTDVNDIVTNVQAKSKVPQVYRNKCANN